MTKRINLKALLLMDLIKRGDAGLTAAEASDKYGVTTTYASKVLYDLQLEMEGRVYVLQWIRAITTARGGNWTKRYAFSATPKPNARRFVSDAALRSMEYRARKSLQAS